MEIHAESNLNKDLEWKLKQNPKLMARSKKLYAAAKRFHTRQVKRNGYILHADTVNEPERYHTSGSYYMMLTPEQRQLERYHEFEKNAIWLAWYICQDEPKRTELLDHAHYTAYNFLQENFRHVIKAKSESRWSGGFFVVRNEEDKQLLRHEIQRQINLKVQRNKKEGKEKPNVGFGIGIDLFDKEIPNYPQTVEEFLQVKNLNKDRR